MTNTLDEREGRYEVIVSVMDKDRYPVPGVHIGVAAHHGRILDEGEATDQNGRMRFLVQTHSDYQVSEFTIKCPAIDSFMHVRLPKPTRKRGWTHGPVPYYIAGTSISVALLCVIWFVILSVSGVAYFLQHPLAEQAVQDMKFERNDAEQSAYQYLDYQPDSVQRAEDSLKILQSDSPPSGALFGVTVLSFILALLLSSIFLSIAAGALVRDVSGAVLLMAMTKRTGVAHDGPNLQTRIVDKALGPPAVATPSAQVQEMIQPQLAARQGILNNILQMALFNISAYFVKSIVKKALLKRPLTP